MKKTIIILLFVFGLCGIYFQKEQLLQMPYISNLINRFNQDPIRIAVAGPMETPLGVAMKNGVEICINAINEKGGIDGRKVELQLYDDQNNTDLAKKVAEEIVEKNEALVVIGHYYSSTSAAAGMKYQREEIPAITGSATADTVTLKNDWYFRTIPNNSIQGEYLATYINKMFKIITVNIIFVNDSYGLSLCSAFELKSKNMGMRMTKKLAFNLEDNWDEQTRKIAEEIKQLDDNAVVFLATHGSEGAAILVSIKETNKPLLIIGSDAFAGDAFISAIKKYPKEAENPGYYTHDMYYASPFMVDIGNKESLKFVKKFEKKYGTIPTWISSCYHDAALVALEAIKQANIQGIGHIVEDRRKIRGALAGFYNESKAVSGVTGYIYFDENGDMKRSYDIGIYRNQYMELPAFPQYRQVTDVGTNDHLLLRKILHGDLIEINGVFMKNITIIYSGIYLLDISAIDTYNSEFTADFIIWFRYLDGFDVENIEFINAVKPIVFDKLISEEDLKDSKKVSYRIKATFRADFSLKSYPFIHYLELPIRFRHKYLTKDKILLIRDTINLKENTPKITLSDWNVAGISFYRDILIKEFRIGNLRDPNALYSLEYSQFNSVITLERSDLKNFVFKKIFPVISFFLVLCLVPLIRARFLTIKIFILLVMITSAFDFYMRYLSDIPVAYFTFFDYISFVIFGFIVLSFIVSIIVYKKNEQSLGT